MSSPSAACEFPGCDRNENAVGLCMTHRRELMAGNPEVQQFVDERERQRTIEQAEEMDWTYLTEVQHKAIEWGVSDAGFEADLNFHDRQNLLQEMLIWAAGHKAEVQKMRSPRLLRTMVKRRAIHMHRAQWRDDKMIDSLDQMAEDMEEG